MSNEIKDSQQCLTFTLDSRTFGLPIERVVEILEYQAITPVPQMPSCVLGAINLRNKLINVIELAERIGVNSSPVTKQTCIVIVEGFFNQQAFTIGFKVDNVRSVKNYDQDQIDPAPAMGGQLNTEFVYGMAKKEEGFTVLLNTDKLLTYSELNQLKSNTSQCENENTNDTVPLVSTENQHTVTGGYS